MTTVTLSGLDDMKRRLQAMSAAASIRTLQPIVERRARTVRDMIAAAAPVGTAPADRHPGRLRAGVVLTYLRGGVGYCKFMITLTKIAYYGIFQELGLGTGRSSGKLSVKTQRARVRFASRQAAYKAGQLKRLRRTGKGRNMAAQPFFRPTVKFTRTWFVNAVLTDIWDAIAGQGERGAK